MTEPQMREEIEKGFSAVKMALGTAPAPFFRFPGLGHTQAALGYLASRNISMFSVDVDSNDFKSSGPDQVIQNVMTKLDKQGKGVILMHDLQKHTALALPTLLRRLKAGGYKVVQMRAKEQLETLPEYDAMLVKDQKTPAVASRPISSVVQTVSQ
jgi:peptidoglycan/xylan/chitin deacetylase (PgdA/CDA1 family)